MPRFMGNMTFVLSFSICSNLFLASCNIVPIFSSQSNNPTSISTASNSLGSLPQRSSYDEIDLNQLPTNVSKKGKSPKSLALDAFGIEEVEGLIEEDIALDTSNPEQVIVAITQKNLPDDSVNSVRYRIDFKSEDSQWQMEWAGQQFICQPGRGNQDWSKELCY